MTSTQETIALHHTPLSRMFRGDPLAYFLWQQGLTPARTGMIVFAYGVIYGLILPAIFGKLGDAFQDWPTLVIVMVVTPLLMGYYVWEPFTIQTLYDGIASRVQGDKYEDDQIARLTRPFGRRLWLWLALLAGVLESIYIINQHGQAAPSWQNIHPLLIATVVPLRFLAFYAVVFIMVRETITIIGVNRFMTIFPVEVAPLHPDKAGGLRVLGHFVLSRGIILGLVGLLFGMNLLRLRLGLGTLSWEFYLEMVIYAIAAPAVFLLPLWRAHFLMAVARQKIMLEVAQKFEQHFYNSIEHIRADTITRDHVEEIEALQKLYGIAEAAPTWPLNVGIILRFSAAILLPVFLPMAIDFIGSLIQKISLGL
jgi:hypothetical protein